MSITINISSNFKKYVIAQLKYVLKSCQAKEILTSEGQRNKKYINIIKMNCRVKN